MEYLNLVHFKSINVVVTKDLLHAMNQPHWINRITTCYSPCSPAKTLLLLQEHNYDCCAFFSILGSGHLFFLYISDPRDIKRFLQNVPEQTSWAVQLDPARSFKLGFHLVCLVKGKSSPSKTRTHWFGHWDGVVGSGYTLLVSVREDVKVSFTNIFFLF
jgi:hypothetical protein